MICCTSDFFRNLLETTIFAEKTADVKRWGGSLLLERKLFRFYDKTPLTESQSRESPEKIIFYILANFINEVI